MAVSLSDEDHVLLDRYLETILDAYKHGRSTLLEAREDLAHTFTQISRDDEGFRAFMKLDR